MRVENKLLWGPVIMINYKDGSGVCVFFGCHSSPTNSFHDRAVICRVGQPNAFSSGGLCVSFGTKYFVPVVW